MGEPVSHCSEPGRVPSMRSRITKFEPDPHKGQYSREVLLFLSNGGHPTAGRQVTALRTLMLGQPPMSGYFAKNDRAWMQACRREAAVGAYAKIPILRLTRSLVMSVARNPDASSGTGGA
jgi:hypothetical protein